MRHDADPPGEERPPDRCEVVEARSALVGEPLRPARTASDRESNTPSATSASTAAASGHAAVPVPVDNRLAGFAKL